MQIANLDTIAAKIFPHTRCLSKKKLLGTGNELHVQIKKKKIIANIITNKLTKFEVSSIYRTSFIGVQKFAVKPTMCTSEMPEIGLAMFSLQRRFKAHFYEFLVVTTILGLNTCVAICLLIHIITQMKAEVKGSYGTILKKKSCT